MQKCKKVHSLSPLLDAARAQTVEAELIDNHREEVAQLKKLLTQKEEDLHKTVQKYEQVLQVARKTSVLFRFSKRKKEGANTKYRMDPVTIWKPSVSAAAHWAVVFLLAACHMNSSASYINNTHHVSISELLLFCI